ncbi:Csu type fimbrial protein [Ramlibacter sp. AN1133]|uniref:Csu type fimbrial protein n=1 Tax=Ramlibacter sp. AN1133 TaxID=3133429 RepID=UPI0030C1428A
MKGRPMHRSRRAAAVALLTLLSTGVMAGACSVSATAVSFGQYQALDFAGKLASTDRTTNATVSVVCTAIVGGGSYRLSLGPSTQGNSIVPRYLARSASAPGMAFNIYLDGTYTSVWGDGFTGAVIIANLPVGDSVHTHTVFGKIPAGQSALTAGAYSASLTITITYSP